MAQNRFLPILTRLLAKTDGSDPARQAVYQKIRNEFGNVAERSNAALSHTEAVALVAELDAAIAAMEAQYTPAPEPDPLSEPETEPEAQPEPEPEADPLPEPVVPAIVPPVREEEYVDPAPVNTGEDALGLDSMLETALDGAISGDIPPRAPPKAAPAMPDPSKIKRLPSGLTATKRRDIGPIIVIVLIVLAIAAAGWIMLIGNY